MLYISRQDVLFVARNKLRRKNLEYILKIYILNYTMAFYFLNNYTRSKTSFNKITLVNLSDQQNQDIAFIKML